MHGQAMLHRHADDQLQPKWRSLATLHLLSTPGACPSWRMPLGKPRDPQAGLDCVACSIAAATGKPWLGWRQEEQLMEALWHLK